MGIATGGAKLILQEASRRPFEGSVLTLGKQNVFFTHADLAAMAAEFGLRLDPRIEPVLSSDPAYARNGFISDVTLFRSLGAENCFSLDCSDFEGSEFVFDLNRNDLPEDLVNRFDLIIDAGTIEHVFHVPNALNNIFRMLRPGGRVIHVSPSSNHVDHGFYMFSPTLFWDFYCANQFEITSAQVFRYTPNHDTDPWEVFDYHPGCLDQISFGGLDDAMYGISLAATKTSRSTGDVVPMQRLYLEWWLRQGRTHDFTGGASAPQVQLAASNRNRANLPAPQAERPPEPVPAPPVQHPVPAPAPRPMVRLARGLLAPCPPVYRLARRIYRSLRGRPFVPEPSAVVPKVQERSSKSLRLKAVARY